MIQLKYTTALRAAICLVFISARVLVFASYTSPSSSSTVVTAVPREHNPRVLQVLDRYEIGEPKIGFAGKVVQLFFPLADSVPDGSVSVITFSDTDCTVDITGNDYIVPSLIYDENQSPDGSKNREVLLQYDVDPIKIQASDVYIQDERDQFFMNFCVSLRLHAGDAESSTPLATLETIVKLQVDFLGGFSQESDVM